MELKIRNLLFIPIVLFATSIVVLFLNFYQTGDFIIKDIDLRGGTQVTIGTVEPVDVSLLEDRLEERYGSVIVTGLRTATGYGATIEIPEDVGTAGVLEEAENLGIEVLEFSEETVGPVLGNIFFEQVRNSLIIAFILMSGVIFLIYRNFVSSFSIVFASLANILTTIALTGLFGIKISFAGFAGLLMLIAFTVDTNIVLTSKVLAHSEESFRSRYKKALITGLTLIATITVTMILVLFLSSSKLLVNIAQVLVIGFLVDLPYTWILNASLLEMHFKRKYGNVGEAT